MRKVVIAPHAYFAGGLKSTIELLIGKSFEIEVVNAYTDDENYMIRIEEYMKKAAPDDEIVVFTDLYGGSVNQKMAQLQMTYDFYLVTGINLPLVLEVMLYQDSLSENVLDQLLAIGREEMKLVKEEEVAGVEEFF